MKREKNWTGYTVQISKLGEIRLRRPAGRTVGWCMKPSDVDAVAQEFLETYQGATLVDMRIRKEAA